MTTGSIIAAARKAKRLTQRQVAEALNVTVQAVSSWETDKALPSPDRAPSLALLLNISAYDLLPEHVRSLPFVDQKAIDEGIAFLGEAKEWQKSGVPLILAKEPTFNLRPSPDNPSAEPTGETMIINSESVGIFVPVKTAFSSEKLKICSGDVLIFDTGVFAKPGDVVLFSMFSRRILQLQRDGGLPASRVSIGRYEADGTNPGEARIITETAVEEANPPESFHLICATMIERRTFRRPSNDD